MSIRSFRPGPLFSLSSSVPSLLPSKSTCLREQGGSSRFSPTFIVLLNLDRRESVLFYTKWDFEFFFILYLHLRPLPLVLVLRHLISLTFTATYTTGFLFHTLIKFASDRRSSLPLKI